MQLTPLQRRGLFAVILTLPGWCQPAGTDARTVTAPKWLHPPKLSGRCTDESYRHAGAFQLLNAGGRSDGAVRTLHSGLDGYFCASGLPAAPGASLAILVNEEPRAAGVAGTYSFAVSQAGVITATRQVSTAKFEPAGIPKDDLAAAVTREPDGTWNAEVRVGLEWLGGYGRTNRLRVEVRDSSGRIVMGWPGPFANTAAWGDLVLAPVYPANLTAGSVFVDGRDGYLVVPYTPELNPKAMTVEAWARPASPSCGTIVGHGQADSYWMAVCNHLAFGVNGVASVTDGQSPVTAGWHHVAVTVSTDGVRAFYVDGQVDLLPDAKEKSFAAEPKTRLGQTTNPLRIGSDRDAPAAARYFHGYIRDLRIWNRVRTAAEIRAGAFTTLRGTEAGLAGWWPFMGTGLKDMAHGHDAGLVGSASLAREKMKVTSFPPVPTAPPLVRRNPPPPKSWDGKIPGTQSNIEIDGNCKTAEYADAARVWLEPDHGTQVFVAMSGGQLHICAPVIMGAPKGKSTLILYLAAMRPSPGDPKWLTLRFTPRGLPPPQDAPGGGSGSPGIPKTGQYRVGAGVIPIQKNGRTINARSWSVEAVISVPSFHAGEELRLATSMTGELPAELQGDTGLRKLLAGNWPKQFKPDSPSTWGLATTAVGTIGQALPGNDAAPPEPRPAAAPLGLVDPTLSDFHNACDYLIPGTVLVDPTFKWPDIDQSNATRTGVGELVSVKYSEEDYPGYHHTHDTDMKMTLRPADRVLALSDVGGSEAQVLETEAGGFPARARPQPQDHVTALGRWVFDCGHEDPPANPAKTELHPIYAMANDHVEVRPILDHRWLRSKVVNVWMNSHPGAAYPEQLPATFSFDIALPPEILDSGTLPFLSVTQQEAAPSREAPTDFVVHRESVMATFSNGVAHVTVTPAARRGHYYWELVMGYLDSLPMPETLDTAKSFVVSLDQIEIHQDLRTSGAEGGSLLGAVTGGAIGLLIGGLPGGLAGAADGAGVGVPLGEADEEPSAWFLNLSFNHNGKEIWQAEGDAENVHERVYNLNIEFPVFPYSPSPTSFPDQLWLHAEGWAKNGQLPVERDNLGAPLFTGERPLGTLSSLADGREHVFPGPADLHPGHDATLDYYTLHYRVRQAPPPVAVLHECADAWSAILARHHNIAPGSTLEIDTPRAAGQRVASAQIDGTLVGPWSCGNSSLLLDTTTTDAYHYTLQDDFSDVRLTGSGSHLESPNLVNFTYDLPTTGEKEFAPGHSNITTAVGYRGGSVQLQGQPQTYNVRFNARYRSVTADPQNGTPANPRLLSLAPNSSFTDSLVGDSWSWQANENEMHYWKLPVPPESTRIPPTRTSACIFDSPQRLWISAYGMHVWIYRNGFPADPADRTNLVAEFDGMQSWPVWAGVMQDFVWLVVSSQAGAGRRVYDLREEFDPPIYYSDAECRQRQTLADAHGNYRKLFGNPDDMRLMDAAHRLPGTLGPPGEPGIEIDPGNPIEIDVPGGRGGYASFTLKSGSAIQYDVSSPDGRPVVARVYDQNGILIAESSRANPAGTAAHLEVRGLTAGRVYGMQVMEDRTIEDLRPGFRVAMIP